MIPAGQGAQSALNLHNLTKCFGGKAALQELSLNAPAGSFTVILGAAGAGKTTTLRLVAGLETPDQGSVSIDGRDMAGTQPKDRDVAMIFDNLALYPNHSGFRNIASPLLVQKVPRQEIEPRVTKIADTLQIVHVLDRLPKTMSGGERQRVALGRALIRTPKLFLLDEPLSSLDAKLRMELRTELRRLQREHGYTFLMATPDFNEALAIADTVVMLRQGRVVQVSPPQELYDAPADRETARFVGAPQINLIQASYQPENGAIQTAGAVLPCPGHLRGALGADNMDFELGIRPENLRLTDNPQAIQATLADIEPLGLKSVLTVANAEAELRLLVDVAQARRLSLGQKLAVEPISPARLLAFGETDGRLITNP